MPIRPRTDDPNVHVSVYDTAVLTFLFPEWPALDPREKLATIRAYTPPPTTAGRDGNSTTTALHRHITAAIDPEQETTDYVSRLAVGTDGASGSDYRNTELNNEVGRTDITDTVYDDTDPILQTTTFADSTQFNDETIDEIGIISEDGDLWNHAVLGTPIEKTNAKTFVVDVFFEASHT